MKILQSNSDQTILLNSETNFRPSELGWEDSMQEFEQDTLKSIINPALNFETNRYIHNPYVGLSGINQTDIWYYFYFYNNVVSGYTGGLNYEFIGLTPRNNAKILRENNNSFFRLEFYKVPSGELPNSSNRKLVFTRHLPIPLSERVIYTPLSQHIFVPIFTGSNYRNTENMFLYWFQDSSVLDGTLLSGDTASDGFSISGDTFYMTAKFYNTIDGTTIQFLNKIKPINTPIDEENDIYHLTVTNRSDYSYIIYSGNTADNRVGTTQPGTPINFYASSISNSSVHTP